MACDLLSKNWTTDEVNSRLGHTPSSRELDSYINFLALDKKKPQRKIYEGNLAKLNAKIDDLKDREKLQNRRFESFKEQQADMLKRLELIQLNNQK